jgi:tetratricopeptide (TPR) repeat protein
MQAKLAALAISLVTVQLTTSAQTQPGTTSQVGAPNPATTGFVSNTYWDSTLQQFRRMTTFGQTPSGQGVPTAATTALNPNTYRNVDYERLRLEGRTGDFLSGDVTVTGGSLPWEPILVTVTCHGKVAFTTTTDPKGGFTIARNEPWGSVVIIGREKSFIEQFVGCTVAAALPGFQSTHLSVPVQNVQTSPKIGSIKLTREQGSAGSAVSATTASAPKEAMKSFHKARNEWLSNKADVAQRELQKAVEIYPQFAEAWYQLGRIQAASKSPEAFASFCKAIAADPTFVLPYQQMAPLSAQAGKWQELLDETDRAFELNPRGHLDLWYYHALANFHLNKLDVAQTSALKSLSMDPLHVQPNTEQLLAVILIAKQNLPAALQHLRNCLTYFPPGPDMDLVQRQIAQLESAGALEAVSGVATDSGTAPFSGTVDDLDTPLPLIPNDFCRIDEVLPKVTSHVEEFVDNVNRFTATEVLTRQRLDRNGNLKQMAESKSNYIATVQKTPFNSFVVGEYRDATLGTTGFHGDITANVAPALVLIFHPSHIQEFDMACHGPINWAGYSTWRVDFRQRLDRPATMSGLEVGTNEFTILLKVPPGLTAITIRSFTWKQTCCDPSQRCSLVGCISQ